MNKCKYCMKIPNKNDTLCGYYIENVKDKGKSYAHYPKCNKTNCPLNKKCK